MAENTSEIPRTDPDAEPAVSQVHVRYSPSGVRDVLVIEASFSKLSRASGPRGSVFLNRFIRGDRDGFTSHGMSAKRLFKMSSRRLPTPSADEVNWAVEVLLREAAARAPEAFDRTVDALVDHVEVDRDRRNQAWLHAEMRRAVLDAVDLLPPREMTRLLPHIAGDDSNTARALDRARARGDLLAVPWRSGWRYPREQVSTQGEVHEGLGDAVRRATAAGYSPWEIIDWFARPTEPTAAPARALAGHGRTLGVDEVVALASAEGASTPAEPGPSPFERLAREDRQGFEDALDAWLE